MSEAGPPASVVLATLAGMLVVASVALALPSYLLALAVRRWLGARARAAGWAIVAAALAGFAFWLVMANASRSTFVNAYGEEIAFAHLAAALGMAIVALWPRGPLRRA